MSQLPISYKHTSQIEIEEGVRIIIGKDVQMALAEGNKEDWVLLIEVNRLTQPTLIKYRYSTNAPLAAPQAGSPSLLHVQIIMGSHWNKYALIKQDIEQSDWKDKVFESYSISLLHRVKELIECISTSSKQKLRLLSLFYGLLAALNEDAQKNEKIPNEDREKLRMIEEILIKTFTSRPPTLEVLSAEIGMSVSKMKLLFKAFYGESIYQFHQQAKLNYAAELLKTQRYTVSQVAYKVGYSHSIKLIKMFEKHFGVTPGKYKNTQ